MNTYIREHKTTNMYSGTGINNPPKEHNVTSDETNVSLLRHWHVYKTS